MDKTDQWVAHWVAILLNLEALVTLYSHKTLLISPLVRIFFPGGVTPQTQMSEYASITLTRLYQIMPQGWKIGRQKKKKQKKSQKLSLCWPYGPAPTEQRIKDGKTDFFQSSSASLLHQRVGLNVSVPSLLTPWFDVCERLMLVPSGCCS